MSLWGTAVVGVIFVVLFVLERFIPLRERNRPLWARLITNAEVTALALLVNATAVQFAATVTQQWTSDQGIGLMYLLPLPTPFSGVVKFILAVLLMDLTFYYWHRANHRFPVLWRFHNAHHIDPDLDISTAFRFHFGEIFFSAGFRAIQVMLIGVSAWAYVIYETAYQANTLFHHSNIKLPLWLERCLNWVLVTPRMHGIHHSQLQAETDSNWSVVFSWWDRLHRTLRLNIPQSEIAIGVPAYTNPEDNTVRHILWMPFQQQRDYWQDSNPEQRDRNPLLQSTDPTQMIDVERDVEGGLELSDRY
jgi:sterol desaturase/sphingolipid hydroxylase (fatty acid hydroxylase superfamily)